MTSAQQKQNFGRANALLVSSGRSAFLKFQLSTLPEGLSGANIAKATLRLWPNNVRGEGNIRVHEALGEWEESTLSANTAPQVASVAEQEELLLSRERSRKFLSVDLTDLVRDWIDGTRLNHGVAIETSSQGFSVWFDSKENPATGHEPQLEVVLVSAGPAGPGMRSDGRVGSITTSSIKATAWTFPTDKTTGEVEAVTIRVNAGDTVFVSCSLNVQSHSTPTQYSVGYTGPEVTVPQATSPAKQVDGTPRAVTAMNLLKGLPPGDYTFGMVVKASSGTSTLYSAVDTAVLVFPEASP